MSITASAKHLKQYKDIAMLLWKYGRSDLVRKSGLDAYMDDQTHNGTANGTPTGSPPEDRKQAAEACQLADDLEKLGPTYIKLGQLLSTRPDLIPPAYTEALARLQDHVEPFPFVEAEKIIASELGVRISRAFKEIDPIPLAAASLGQVHKAVLRDGRQVAIKVQRPGIRARMIEDMDVLAEVAGFLDQHTEAGQRHDYSSVLAEFRKMLLRELDYTQEAHNLRVIHKNLASFQRIVVPRPIDDYTTSCVLTMEYMTGTKITKLSPVARIEVDGDRLAEDLFKAYLQQILVDGFFHADPHPGNVFLNEDNNIALLDLGMAAQLSPQFQEDLLPMVLDMAEGRSEGAMTFAEKHGVKLDDYNEKELRRRISELVARNRGASLRHMEVGALMLEIRTVATDCGLRLPPELALIGKTLLNLDQIGWTLDPDFDPAGSVRRHAAELMQQRFYKSLAPGNLFARGLEMKDFVQHLPGRVNRIMDVVANNELKLNVDAIDEKYLMTGLQKVANRITMGLILAAMIIGAALLMRVATPNFQIFGYPGLAILFFLLAAGGAIALVFQILFYDEATQNKH